jgi:hypothetical protein
MTINAGFPRQAQPRRNGVHDSNLPGIDLARAPRVRRHANDDCYPPLAVQNCSGVAVGAMWMRGGAGGGTEARRAVSGGSAGGGWHSAAILYRIPASSNKALSS